MSFVASNQSSPFVPDSRHDIFISYAHRDNLPVGEHPGWVTTFADILSKRLTMELGADCSLWMDDFQVVGNRPLTRQLMEALEGTATFLVIASPAYLASEWCRAEREEFMRLIKARTESDSRVFLVELNKVAREEFPVELGDLVPYSFWMQEKGFNRILGWPHPNDSELNYYDQIARVCAHMADELKRLRRAARAAAAAPSAEAAARVAPATAADAAAHAAENMPAVYVADVTGDLNLVREAVVDYLEQAGFRALPETWQRYESLADFDAAFERDISQCEFFVQLLSEDAGEPAFGLVHGMPRLQYERAAAAGKTIIQWRDKGLVVGAGVGTNQRALLEGSTVRAEGIEEFKAAVVEAAARKPTPARRPKPGKLVYIGAGPEDEGRVDALVNSSDWAQSGVGGLMLKEDDDPGTFWQAWEETLLNCDGALLVYLQSDPRAVITKIKKYCGFLLSQPEPPFVSVGIYDGPPPPDQKVGISVIKYPKLNLRNLNCRKDHKELADFLNSL